jgi:hypothetical protein
VKKEDQKRRKVGRKRCESLMIEVICDPDWVDGGGVAKLDEARREKNFALSIGTASQNTSTHRG